MQVPWRSIPKEAFICLCCQAGIRQLHFCLLSNYRWTFAPLEGVLLDFSVYSWLNGHSRDLRWIIQVKQVEIQVPSHTHTSKKTFILYSDINWWFYTILNENLRGRICGVSILGQWKQAVSHTLNIQTKERNLLLKFYKMIGTWKRLKKQKTIISVRETILSEQCRKSSMRTETEPSRALKERLISTLVKMVKVKRLE